MLCVLSKGKGPTFYYSPFLLGVHAQPLNAFCTEICPEDFLIQRVVVNGENSQVLVCSCQNVFFQAPQSVEKQVKLNCHEQDWFSPC